jgi:hypothetical protein
MATSRDRRLRPDVHASAARAAELNSRTHRRDAAARVLGYLGGVVIGIGALAIVLSLARGDVPWLHSGGSASSNLAARWQRPAVSDAGLAARSGVRIVHVALTGGGGLLDLRFQVLDPAKAAALHDRARPPALVSEDNGVVANELLMGHEHTGSFHGGQSYYFVFTNPGNLIERDSRVMVLLGDASVRHVRVR